MADRQQTADYENNFDPVWYYTHYYEFFCQDVAKDPFIKFCLDGMHDVFEADDVPTGRLLEVGTGPTIHSIISASRCVDEIYLSDFAKQNRELLTDWWKGDVNIQGGIVEYVLRKENDSQSVEDRQNIIRRKVRGILPINVHDEDPLSGDVLMPFDIVLSSLCLEVASNTLEDYGKAMKNITSLLRPNGWLVLLGLCGQSYYRVGEKEFLSLPLELSDAQSTLENLKYTLLSMRWIKTKDTEYSDTKAAFIIVAQKTV